MSVEVIDVDYANALHVKQLVELLDAYAQDPMGGGRPLDEAVKSRLPIELARRADAFSVIARVGGEPAGLINCFEGFSTFKAKPLINIHDVTVLPGHRGLRLAQRMLDRVEAIAHARGCCKLTLEVLSGNAPAQAAYRRFGFAGSALDEKTGSALFWEKTL